MPTARIIRGDCLTVLQSLPASSIEALVTDPPAGISFMGKDWDGDRGGREEWIGWMTAVMRAAFRVLKPGAHGLVWAIPRTSHWTATALENAGFEVRDVVTHLFGSGFPKSLDVSKAIDKAAGAEREVLAPYQYPDGVARRNHRQMQGTSFKSGGKAGTPVTAPATRAAKQWSGWGTALKPASEHWILVRKPLAEKTVAANVLKWGTGALNVDGSRIGTENVQCVKKGNGGTTFHGRPEKPRLSGSTCGRFPANLVLDEAAAEMLDAQSGERKSGGAINAPKTSTRFKNTHSQAGVQPHWDGFRDTGGASRFFYVAKASTRDKGAGNTHPTVKSTKLMEYLIRMVTPAGGTVLDPFAGSGTTAVSAKRLGFRFVGIERSPEYVRIAKRRLKAA